MINLSKIFSSFSTSKTYTLTLIRHGQSIWNQEKRWAGWTDVPLSANGIKQIHQCAKLLKNKGIQYDVVYTSVLIRAIKSANQIMNELDINYIPIHKQWRLNQKHYGSLQGKSKVQAKQKYGDQLVSQWRRSMSIPPPPLDITNETHPSNNPKYKDIDRKQLPNGQALSDIIKRVKILWDQKISKDIIEGKNVMIVAHGSPLRALLFIMNLDKSQQQLRNFNIPNATPVIITLNQNLKALTKQYLGDKNQIAKKMKKIKFQTQRKQI